jgi:predicted chitinase
MPVDPIGMLSRYTGTKTTDNVDEDINEVILRLLGLEDTFDIDYDTYRTLLKQKLVENQILTSQGKGFPSEEMEILTNEYRRIKSKVGRFTIKKKKITVESFARGRKSESTDTEQTQKPAQTLIGPGLGVGRGPSAAAQYKGLEPVQEEPKKKERKVDTLLDSLRNIRENLKNILKALKGQLKAEQTGTEKERRSGVSRRRQTDEDKLEKKRAKELKKIQEKMLAPVKGLLDKVWTFIKFTFLGAIFTKFVKWFTDPKNAKKIEVLGRLLETFWPALLAAFLLFMTPFGGFVRNTIRLVGFFAKGMAKIMPMLLNALRNLKLSAGGRLTGRGKFAVAAGVFAAGAMIPALMPGTVDSQERKTESAPGSKSEKIKKLQEEKKKVGFFDPWGKKSEIDEQIHRLQTGQTKGYSGGGSIFSGFVGRDTGVTVAGGGKDTQLLPIEGGGSAVLQRGELVLNEEQQQKLANETGVDPAKFVVGAQPSNLTGDLRPAWGQSSQGYSSGGIIGSGKVGFPSSMSNNWQQGGSIAPKDLWSYYTQQLLGKIKGLKFPEDKTESWKEFVRSGFGKQSEAPKITKTVGPSNPANLSANAKIDLAMGMWSKYRDQKNYKQADSIGKDIWNLKYKDTLAKPKTPNPLMAGFRSTPAAPAITPTPTPAAAAPKVPGMAGGGAIMPHQLGVVGGKASAKNIAPVYQQSLPMLFSILQGGRWKEKGWNSKEFMQMLTSRMMQESGNFTKTREQYTPSPNDPKGKPGWNYFNKIRGYGSNPVLGNKGDADGYNFIGRGPVQLTGRTNYEMFNKWLVRNGYKGYDVVKNPGLIEKDPKIQALSVLAYMENRQKLFPDANLGQMAKTGNLKDFVYSINGGHHGLETTKSNLNLIKKTNVNFGQTPRIVSTAKPTSKPAAKSAEPKRAWYDPRGWVGKQHGGKMVTENTGVNIPGGTADRQLVALQPGENHYIFPKKFVDMGGISHVDKLVAQFDPNSAPAKDGQRGKLAQLSSQVNRNVPGAPVTGSMGGAITLPPINKTSMPDGLPPAEDNSVYTQAPIFNAHAVSGIPERKRLTEMYGIVG